VLLVPLAYKPPTLPTLRHRCRGEGREHDDAVDRIGLPLLVWHFTCARDQVIKVVLATPPELLASAGARERARVDAMLDHILPVSVRAEGLRSDTAVGKHLAAAPLESVRAPTLIISGASTTGTARMPSAQYTASRIAGAKVHRLRRGGHTWVGHDDEVMSEIVKLLVPTSGHDGTCRASQPETAPCGTPSSLVRVSAD
jgi:hypothetical protein